MNVTCTGGRLYLVHQVGSAQEAIVLHVRVVGSDALVLHCPFHEAHLGEGSSKQGVSGYATKSRDGGDTFQSRRYMARRWYSGRCSPPAPLLSMMLPVWWCAKKG